VFARGFIRARLGSVRLRVISPTYLLQNTYEACDGLVIHHVDMYRLINTSDAATLYMLGFPDVLRDGTCLIEWPRNVSFLTKPQLNIDIRTSDRATRLLNVDASVLDYEHAWSDVLAALNRSCGCASD